MQGIIVVAIATNKLFFSLMEMGRDDGRGQSLTHGGSSDWRFSMALNGYKVFLQEIALNEVMDRRYSTTGGSPHST